MAAIYEMESGTIVSEKLPEYGVTLQPVQAAARPARPGPCDEYMSILKELLKDL
jgi:hypothetical protein